MDEFMEAALDEARTGAVAGCSGCREVSNV